MEVMSKELEVVDEGRPEIREGKIMYVVLFERQLRDQLARRVNTLGWS